MVFEAWHLFARPWELSYEWVIIARRWLFGFFPSLYFSCPIIMMKFWGHFGGRGEKKEIHLGWSFIFALAYDLVLRSKTRKNRFPYTLKTTFSNNIIGQRCNYARLSDMKNIKNNKFSLVDCDMQRYPHFFADAAVFSFVSSLPRVHRGVTRSFPGASYKKMEKPDHQQMTFSVLNRSP